MRKIQYTKATLDKFTLKELQKICKYYDVQFVPSWSKAKLVKAILEYTPAKLIGETYHFSGYDYIPPVTNAELPKVEIKKSIRIQRIEDRKEK